MNDPMFYRLFPEEVRDLFSRPNLHLIDVRDPDSFNKEHIETAINASNADVERMIWRLPKQDPILIYCYHGNASQVFAQMFVDFGFSEVYDLAGGFDAWQKAQANADQTADLSAEVNAWLSEQGFPVNALNALSDNKTTPLMRAAQLGASNVASELLNAGANIHAVNGDGNNALWLACFSESVEIINLLVQHGIDLNNQNDNGATCLMYAASAGKTKAVAALINAGCDVRLKTVDDFTALDMAANLECLKLLRAAAPRMAEAAT